MFLPTFVATKKLDKMKNNQTNYCGTGNDDGIQQLFQFVL